MKLFRPQPVAWCFTAIVVLGTIVHVRGQVAGDDEDFSNLPTAKEDMYAPADLDVVDVERSMRVFSARGEPVPLVVRVDSHSASLMVEQLNEAFARTHEAFLSALEKTYGSRQIEIRRINSAKFRSFRNEFQSGNPLFPVNLVLAQSWAKGYDGLSILERLTSAVEAVMREYYMADFHHDAVLFITSVPVDADIESWNDAAKTIRLVDHGEIIGLEEAGFYIRRSLDALDRSAGGFITGLLQPTVKVDPYLTGLLMHERLGGRTVMRKLNEGDAIVRAGEPIDHWAELSLNTVDRMGLEALNVSPGTEGAAKAEVGLPVQSEEGEEVVAEAPGALPSVTHREPSPAELWVLDNPMLVGGIAGGLVVFLGIVFWALFRKRSQPTSLVVRNSGKASDLREAIVPHLARELKNRLVGVLYAQRHALLENEQAASERVKEMEARLARLQPAIAEKIRKYEQRIQVLEQEIEEKDQETRDLLRAKLVLARKELDAEINRTRLDWN